MSEDVHQECERLFVAAAPFVRAEQDAEEALKVARSTLKAYRDAAAVARAAWVDYLLTHDHRTICRGLEDEPLATTSRVGDGG